MSAAWNQLCISLILKINILFHHLCLTMAYHDNNQHRNTTIDEFDQFTLRDIREIIPPHLFHRSYVKSFYWLFHDIVLITIMYYIGITYLNKEHIPSASIRALLWLFWWSVQSALFTGVWILGHECGHHAFTPSKWINNTVGIICHSILLTPYFSWQYSHVLHHSKPNNLRYDTAWNPGLQYENSNEAKHHSDNYIQRIATIIVQSLVTFPLYLWSDIITDDAQNDLLNKLSLINNHFNPNSALFPRSMFYFVILSDIFLVGWMYCLYLMYLHLQHIDGDMQRFKPCEWLWLRGVFETVDRDFGFFLDYVFHRVTSSHVIHHLFPTMPHYNAIKATKYLKASKFKRYYKESKKTWYESYWELMNGKWIKKTNNILQFKI
eukprot:418036_1